VEHPPVLRGTNRGGRIGVRARSSLSRTTSPFRGPTAPSSSPAYRPPPILADVEGLLASGSVAEAFRIAYLTAEEDTRRAFNLKLPRQWTHREFLARFLRPDMGYITVLLPQLHAMFEPARYGAPGELPASQLMPLLRALYQEPPLRSLGLLPTAGPSVVVRPRATAPPGGMVRP
jgi:hypothetical protein